MLRMKTTNRMTRATNRLKFSQGLASLHKELSRNTQQPGGPPAQFVWGQGVVDNEIPAFSVRPGPVRVWGGEYTPVTLFQLFWNDNLFDFSRI